MSDAINVELERTMIVLFFRIVGLFIHEKIGCTK